MIAPRKKKANNLIASIIVFFFLRFLCVSAKSDGWTPDMQIWGGSFFAVIGCQHSPQTRKIMCHLRDFLRRESQPITVGSYLLPRDGGKTTLGKSNLQNRTSHDQLVEP